MQNIVIFDIDGTLANIDHRRLALDENPKNWPKFWGDLDKDTLIEPVAAILVAMHSEGFIINISTGRWEKYRQITEDWLDKYGLLKLVSAMSMRPDGDYRKDEVIKQEALDMMDKSRILFVVDDRQRVVDMWRRNGLICLQAAKGNF